MTNKATSLLLEPIQIGSRTVRNRVASTAHGGFTGFFSQDDSGNRYIDYQRRRAAGGCGMLVLQAMHVHPSSPHHAGHPFPETDDIRHKLQRLMTAVQPHGTTVIQQLLHHGIQGSSDGQHDPMPRWGFSAVGEPGAEPTHVMTAEEIDELVDAFTSSAVLAVESGVHGVELHATHGYLLQQSFSPWANRRTDSWGEPLRFVTQVLRRVRSAIGSEPIVGLRITTDDWRGAAGGGLSPEELTSIAAHLVGRGGLDYLSQSQGSRPEHYSRSIGSYRHPGGEFLPLAGNLRAGIGAAIPVMAVGGIATADLAEHALEEGHCDLVGMTRALIADPDFVMKVATRRTDFIRPCVAANVCIDSRPHDIRCFHNPDVGREGEAIGRRRVSKNLLVVGGGPSGLKAAETAALLGHDVTLVERQQHLGGRLRLTAGLGRAAEMQAAVAHLEHSLKDLQVEVITRTTVDASFLAQAAPIEIILATGARAVSVLPDSDDSVPTVSIDDVAEAAASGEALNPTETKYLVVDHAATVDVALIAEFLARSKRVTIATPQAHYGGRVGKSHLGDLLPYFARRGVRVLTATDYVAMRDGAVRLLNVWTGDELTEEFDVVVVGRNPRSDVTLLGDAKKFSSEVQVVGDALSPLGVSRAIHDGHRAALNVGVARGERTTQHHMSRR